jgi:hypothetical protein
VALQVAQNFDVCWPGQTQDLKPSTFIISVWANLCPVAWQPYLRPACNDVQFVLHGLFETF